MDSGGKVTSEEMLVEDFDLPDIQGIKSQWESPAELAVPLPIMKSPAAIAREKEIEEKRRIKLAQQNGSPVNREDEQEPQEEKYEVELNKLKAQFENSSQSSPPLPTTPTSKRGRKSSLKDKSPDVEEAKQPADVIRSSDVIEDMKYEVEIKSLRKMFDLKPAPPQPAATPTSDSKKKKTKRRTFSSSSSSTTVSTAPSTGSNKSKENVPEEQQQPASTIEIVKSSEPLNEEMIGEESVKDRLARYKEMASKAKADAEAVAVVSRSSKKKKKSASVIRNKSNRKSAQVADPSPSGDQQQQQKQQEQKQTETEQQQVEIVRPTPAGSKEQVEYELSIDLKRTKALFETRENEQQKLPTATRRSSTRSEHQQQRRRSSSATSSTRSASPGRSSKRSSSAHSTRSRDGSEMAEVVRPPPAGTKEVVEVQPSLSISAARSMFESKKDESGGKIDVDFTSPRRRQLKSGWATNASKDDESKVVKEGAFVENNGVVRPPTAGTKETPDYHLESNALKARAAIFQQGKGNEYKPRNTIKKEENKIAEIVNRKEEGDADNEDFVPSIDQKAARSVFENNKEQSKNVDVPRTVNDVVRASNMNAAKGVFSGAGAPPAATSGSSEDEKSSSASSTSSSDEDEKQEQAAPAPAQEEVTPVEPQQQSFDLAPITEPVATQEPQGFDLAPITEPVATQEPQGFDLAPITEPVATQEPQGFDLAPITEPVATQEPQGFDLAPIVDPAAEEKVQAADADPVPAVEEQAEAAGGVEEKDDNE